MTEGEPKSRVEYRRTLLGIIGIKDWKPLGDGIFEHTEEVSYAIQCKTQRFITATRPDVGGMIVVTELRYNKEKNVHETRTLAFSGSEIEDLNKAIRFGVFPRQFRIIPLQTSKPNS